jgi:hypothetical protein
MFMISSKGTVSSWTAGVGASAGGGVAALSWVGAGVGLLQADTSQTSARKMDPYRTAGRLTGFERLRNIFMVL